MCATFMIYVSVGLYVTQYGKMNKILYTCLNLCTYI